MYLKMTDEDIYYFKKGLLYESYHYFGAHLIHEKNSQHTSCIFRVYAQNATKIYVFGDFNHWDEYQYEMIELNDSKVFEIIIPNVKEYQSYKYVIYTSANEKNYKSDPFAFYSDVRPSTNSKIYDGTKYTFKDKKYLKNKTLSYNKPILIYEMHLQSFKYTNNTKEKVSYLEITEFLVKHLKDHNFTHVEFLPLYEHPLDDSWGYMTTGYFSPTSRFGNPDELKYLIDTLHQNNIGVIFDFIVGHICKDSSGLYNFDGKYLYDYDNEDIRENREWGTSNLDLNKGCTKSLLFSSAMYFLKNFHIDGFRIDAVSNLIYYLGDSNKGINNDAITFLKELSDLIFAFDEKILYIAEDSTSYPNVTKRSQENGLGFNYKWNMGFMHDTLKYFEADSLYRKYLHNNITFGMMYHHTENFMLAYSHDEVVHGKKSLLDKMPGNYEEKFSNVRVLLGLFFSYPGKKTLFMGFEIGQFIEWNFKRELDWFLLEYELHDKLNQFVKDLTKLYVTESSLYYKDFSSDGFRWIDSNNAEQSIFSFYRFGKKNEKLVILLNCTPNSYDNYEIGVLNCERYIELINSNSLKYGGNGFTNENQSINVFKKQNHGFDFTINIKLNGLSFIVLKEIDKKKEE